MKSRGLEKGSQKRREDPFAGLPGLLTSEGRWLQHGPDLAFEDQLGAKSGCLAGGSGWCKAGVSRKPKAVLMVLVVPQQNLSPGLFL